MCCRGQQDKNRAVHMHAGGQPQDSETLCKTEEDTCLKTALEKAPLNGEEQSRERKKTNTPKGLVRLSGREEVIPASS